jgi:hypothetical protein
VIDFGHLCISINVEEHLNTNRLSPVRLEIDLSDQPQIVGTLKNKVFRKWQIIVLAMSIIISACSPRVTPDQSQDVGSASADTMKTQEAQTAVGGIPTATIEIPTPTQTPAPTATVAPSPTITPTPTEIPPMIRVAENTNCRTGPGTSYLYQGVLQVDEVAQVLARSTLEDYWYVLLPDEQEEPCWLSGIYASLEGDTSLLPVFTPMPTPAPPVGFDLYLRGFESCGPITYVVFSVKNAGVEILKSANVEVVEFGTGKSLYGPDFQRFPFAQVVRPVCPPDHGNILDPGVVAFIHVPIDPVPHGETARGEIMLCTGDWLGGDCVTKEIYFVVE